MCSTSPAGYGEPSLTAARAAAPNGSVVATDISAQMMVFGRERAAEQGIDNIEFVEAAANTLDFPTGTFDAALSRWGIIFDPDGEGAAARVRTFLKPGARMAISSWGPPDRVPMLGIPVAAALRETGSAPPPPGMPGPLSRPTPEAIGGLLEGGGFSDVQVEETEVTFEYGTPEDFRVFIHEIAPPVNALIEQHPADVQERAWNAIVEDVRAQSTDDDGVVRMTNLVLLASGRA